MWDLNFFDKEKPLYLSIVEALERDIHSSVLKPGAKLPTHRDLAQKIGVAVTTVTRAYTEAEKRGLINAVVGKGTYVSDGAYSKKTGVQKGSCRGQLIEMGATNRLYFAEPEIRPIIQRILDRGETDKFMRYNAPQGLPEHREVGAKWINRLGMNVLPESVIVTAGPQQAMTCAVSSAFDMGEIILVDQLVNPTLRAFAHRAGVALQAVQRDEEGMIPEELDAVCCSGLKTIRGLYTTGNAEVPGNKPMSSKRRNELAKIIRKYNLAFVEDDSFNGYDVRRTPLSILIPESYIYLTAVSSSFYAGLRTSFVSASPKLYSRIVQAIAETMWMAPPLCTEISCECIRSGVADKIIKDKCKELAIRVKLFREKFQGYRTGSSEHNMYGWIALPDYWSSTDFAYAAEKEGVRVHAAEKFAVGPLAPPNYIRISFVGPETMSEYKRGIEILLRVIKRESGYASIIW